MGAPHTAKRSQGSIVVSMGCPLATYIKEWSRRGRPRGGGAPKGGNPTPSRIPPSFLVQVGEGKEGKEKEKEGEGGKGGKGGQPPSPIRFGLGGPRALPPLFHHLAHEAHCFFLVFP